MRKFLAVVRAGWIETLSFKADLLLFVLSGICAPIITLIIWLAIYASGGNPPISQNEMINYYLLVMFIEVVNSAWSQSFVARDINKGLLSKYLVKPFDYIHWFSGENLGQKISKLIYLIPILIAMTFILGQSAPFYINSNLLLFILSLVLSVVLNFLLDFCVGLTAFWFSDISFIDEIWDILYFTLSGKVMPLITLPLIFRDFATILPFRYTLSLPIEIITGKLNSYELIFGLGMQIGWLILFIILYKLLWRFGIRKYSAFGA